MSLTVSLYSALASLQATQAAFQVSSNNVANANTEGYTAKSTTQTTQVVGGQASGVSITGIQRTVDENLLRQVRAQFTKVAGLEVQESYFTRMQQLFGTLGNDGSLGHTVTELGTALDALATTPESAGARGEVINLAMRLTSELNFMSREVQKMREEADAEVSATIDRINDQMTSINNLNNQIANARALGQPSADLEDIRDLALDSLAKDLSINYFTRSDGRISVYSESGAPLIENAVTLLVHTPASSVSAELTYPTGIGPITLGTGGTDITNQITTGSLAALVGLRDDTLVNLQAELDRISEAISNNVNASHNDGTAFPPPVSLTGARAVAATDAPPMTGTFRVTVMDTAGLVVENLDINLATLAPPNIGQLVTTINAMTNATASINATGQVVLSATGGNTIGVNEMTSALSNGAQTRGMSHFLGLNDFYDTGEVYNRYQGDRVASDTAALGVAGTLTVAHGATSTGIAYLATDSITDVAAAITAALAAQNITATVLSESSGFRIDLNDTDGDNFFITDSANLASTLNLRAGQPGLSSRIGVNSAIANDSNRIAVGQVNAGTLAVGDVAVSGGDGTKISEMAAAFAGDLSFAKAGGLAAMTTRLADYAATILSVNATTADNVERDLSIGTSYSQALTARASSISQVNIDEEMSNIIILQNAYQAAARVTSAVSEMMDVLIQIGR